MSRYHGNSWCKKAKQSKNCKWTKKTTEYILAQGISESIEECIQRTYKHVVGKFWVYFKLYKTIYWHNIYENATRPIKSDRQLAWPVSRLKFNRFTILKLSVNKIEK